MVGKPSDRKEFPTNKTIDYSLKPIKCGTYRHRETYAKLTGPQTFADKRWGWLVKPLCTIQRFKIIYLLMGPWNPPWSLNGSQCTGKGSHHWCFYLLEILRCVHGHGWLVADESLLSFNEYMTQDAAISESLVIMHKISKIRPKSLLGPTKAKSFRCVCTYMVMSTYTLRNHALIMLWCDPQLCMCVIPAPWAVLGTVTRVPTLDQARSHVVGSQYIYPYHLESCRPHYNITITRWRPGQKCRAAGHNRQHVINRRLWVLPTCPEWLRLSPGLPSPADAGLWQLTQGSRYGSHHARSLETLWWIGNKNCQILRCTHSKLCYM